MKPRYEIRLIDDDWILTEFHANSDKIKAQIILTNEEAVAICRHILRYNLGGVNGREKGNELPKHIKAAYGILRPIQIKSEA